MHFDPYKLLCNRKEQFGVATDLLSQHSHQFTITFPWIYNITTKKKKNSTVFIPDNTIMSLAYPQKILEAG